MPRLGFFATNPSLVPVDYAEIISGIAPRPLMVIAPSLDRHADPTAVNETMEKVTNIYGLYSTQQKVRFQTPPEINRMTEPMYAEIADFLGGVLK